MYLQVDDIIEWIEGYNKTDAPLQGKELESFIEELHNKIAQMDFSVNEGTTIIGYSGESNGSPAWKIAKDTSKQAGKGATYISDLSAGNLIGESRDDLKDALKSVVGRNDNDLEKIISGVYKDESGKWVRVGDGKCGFGDTLPSIDDFVSAKLMGETIGASNNIIIFIPDKVDPTKVFATTEIEQIFKNGTFEYINGIPKSELEAIYHAGEKGKQSFFEIITQTSHINFNYAP